jgi:pimeloyl-ACP methyl ester carboxylesterase
MYRLRSRCRSLSPCSRAPRNWAEQVYPNLVYFHEAGRGGHFAAWEEPQLFTEELRAAFGPLR